MLYPFLFISPVFVNLNGALLFLPLKPELLAGFVHLFLKPLFPYFGVLVAGVVVSIVLLC